MTDPVVRVDSMAHMPVSYIYRPDLLMDRLTLQTKQGLGSDETTVFVQLFHLDGVAGTLSVPREFFFKELRPAGWQWSDETVYPILNEPLKFIGELDPSRDQPNAVETILSQFGNGTFGGILHSPAGTGKTVMALSIIAALKTPTIILVHSDFLVIQWRDRIQQFLGVEPGIIQQDRFEIDQPIVIAMIQSLISRRYPPALGDTFGLVLADETHRLGSRQWHKAIKLFKSKYRLGLSATPYRQDDLTDVFLWHMGPVLYRTKAETLKPMVYQYQTNAVLPRWLASSGRERKSKMVSLLANNTARNELIARLLKAATLKNRKTIVFSERLSLLWAVRAMLIQNDINSIGMYVGGRTEGERSEAAKQDIILSTYQFAREALDIPELDCVFLATPVAQVQQAIGRILRKCEGKQRPLVIDFVDGSIPYLRGLGHYRRSQYDKLGYEMKTFST